MKIDIFNTDKKYNIIYADPPWSYKDKALARNRGCSCKYDVMTTNDICQLPIRNISTDDAICFMWATFPQIAEALKTLKEWGFAYKTAAFVWVKKN